MTDIDPQASGAPFDVNAFMSNIIRTIDSSRSDFFTNPSKIVENLINEQAGEGLESRINTFYRLIGLPATRDLAPLLSANSVNPTPLQLSQYNTLNYIDSAAIVISDNSKQNSTEKLTPEQLANKLSSRENLYKAAPSVEQMLQIIQQPLRISDSLFGVPQRKASIFPMIVDAATPVYPLSKRTAPAFYDGDFVLSGAKNTRLPRPFIENVIYIRTYVFAGGNNANFQQSIANNIKKFVKDNSNLSEQDLNILLANTGISTAEFFSQLEGELISKFIEALKSCAIEYRQIINQANEFKAKVRFSPVSSDTPGVKVGNSSQIVEKSVAGEIDRTISKISLELETIVKRLSMLPTNQIMEAETNFRADAGIANLNITTDAFMSDFSALITFDREEVEKRLSEANQAKQSLLNQYNKILQKIQYFTGESTGLSVFEVLCIFLALFTIDIKSLVSLLNNDAKNRLLSNPYYSFQNSVNNSSVSKKPIFTDGENLSKVESALENSSSSVSEAIETLEKTVKEHFALASAFFASSGKTTPDSPGEGGNNYVYNMY
jgi:hypothetical protein